MNESAYRKSAAEFRRRRRLKTANPFCRICGKDQLWANYDRHHVDGRAYSEDQLFICRDCHEEIHAMLREHTPIPNTVPKSRHRLIHMARGQMAICRLSLKKWGEIEDWLINDIDLPDAQADNDNDDDDDDSGGSDGGGSAGGVAATLARPARSPDLMASLEAKFGLLDSEEDQ